MTKFEKVRALLSADSVEGVLIRTKQNKQYFGALGGSGVSLLLTSNDVYQIIDGRYTEEARKKTAIDNTIVVSQGNYLHELISIIKKLKITNLAIESDGFSIQDYFNFIEQNIEIDLWTDEITKIRSIKTKEEIEKIKAACDLTDEVFSKVISKINPGMQENELSALIQYHSLKRGASSMAFDPIVASGPRSAMPHGRPTNRKFAKGDFITIDFGVVLENYQSDMTRTVALGEPKEELKNIYDIVLSAQVAGINAIQKGAIAWQVDKAARIVIEEAGYGENFSHGLGHGIGMGGDMPILNQKSEMVLENNMVMSCEPGIYIPQVGGVRIEDDVVIEEGKGVPLNKTSKKLLII